MQRAFATLVVAIAFAGSAPEAHASRACDVTDGNFSHPGIVTVDLSEPNRPDNALTGLPLSGTDVDYQFTVAGVTFLFESSSVALAHATGLRSFGFNGDNALIVSISPTVTDVGFYGVEDDGCPGATFSGTTGNEAYYWPTECGAGPCPPPSFVGAWDIGDIGTFDASWTAAVFYLTELRFLPPGVIPSESADLGLTKSITCTSSGDCTAAGPGAITALPGATFEWDLVVDNNGPDDAPDVLITDFLPPGMYTGSPNGSVVYDASAELATLDAGTLTASTSTSVVLEGSAPSRSDGFSCGAQLLNVAQVSSGAVDPRLAEDPADNPVVNRNTHTAVIGFDRAAVTGTSEVCGNGIDDNCDGRVDCGDAAQCNCRPTIPPLPGGDPMCWGGFQEALVDIGLFIPDLCAAGNNNAAQHACTVPRGACGGVTVPSWCCDAATWSNPSLTLDIAQSCGTGVPGCAPRDPNFKSADPGVNLHGYGYTEAGQTITYTVHYENIGDADAHDVVILDVLDPDLLDGTLVINDGGSYDAGDRLLSWTDPVVPPATPRSVSFSVDVRGDATPGTRVRNVGTIVFPDAVPPTRIDTNFVEHVVPAPTLDLSPDLFVSGCTETASGSGEYQVHLVNDGAGFAHHVTATLVSPPDAVTVSQAIAADFSHPDDLVDLPTVIAFATTTSGDTVSFTTQTPADPCSALTWRLAWEDIVGNAFTEDVQAEADDDEDAVADDDDNCPLHANPTQLDTDDDGDGDVCDDDDDGDGVPDDDDSDPLDPGTCRDSDGDGCDDCASGIDDPDDDGDDADADGICDPGDACPGTAAGASVNADGCSEAQLDPGEQDTGDDDERCGCASSAPGPAWWLLLAVAPVLLRRGRVGAPS